MTVITRKAYGGAYVMASSTCAGCELRRPTSEVGGDGGKGATEICIAPNWAMSIKSLSAPRSYEDRFANPFVAAERGFIDEVIQPQSTRKRVCKALAMLRRKKRSMPLGKNTITSRCDPNQNTASNGHENRV